MPYATPEDMQKRFGERELTELTDREGTGSFDYDVVAARLADADAMVDAFLARRYALPLSPVPALVARASCDIARFFLAGNAATEMVRKTYEDQVKILRDLAAGTAVLPGAIAAPAGQSPAAPPSSPRIAAPERVFGRGTIGDYLG